jgi:hypothetical protein
MRIRISEASPLRSAPARPPRAGAIRDLVAALMADGRERYSIEVAVELGLDPERAYPRVRSALTALEDVGALTSRFVEAEPTARSGLGRRYYRLSPKG